MAFNYFKNSSFVGKPNPSGRAIENLDSTRIFPPSGQQLFTSTGSQSWTAPAGVTSVCVVCVGGGGGGMYYNNSNSGHTYAMSGGGGGALAWANDIPVTPGQSYTVVVGVAGTQGAYSAGSTAGGSSYFISTSNVLASGGSPGRYNINVAGGTRFVSSSYTSSGGGNGGGTIRTSATTYGPAGGGGAGGYSGNRGTGRDDAVLSGNGGKAVVVAVEALLLMQHMSITFLAEAAE